MRGRETCDEMRIASVTCSNFRFNQDFQPFVTSPRLREYCRVMHVMFMRLGVTNLKSIVLFMYVYVFVILLCDKHFLNGKKENDYAPTI